MTDKRQNVRRLQVCAFQPCPGHDVHKIHDSMILVSKMLFWSTSNFDFMLVAGSEERAECQGANASRGASAPSGAVQLRRRGG